MPTVDLARAGFTLAKPTLRRRLIVASHGMDGSGKTHWGLTAPGDTALLNHDRGVEGVVDKFLARGQRVHQIDVHFSKLEDKEAYQTHWKKALTAYRAGLKSDGIRTVVIDTGTAFWELAQLAEFGKVEQVPPLKRVELNKEFSAIVAEAFSADCNVVWTHRMRKQYVLPVDERGRPLQSARLTDSYWNGLWEPARFSGMQYDVQVVVEHFQQNGAFGLRVLKCRQNGELVGTVLGADSGLPCDFATLAQLVFPDTGPEDWQ